MVRVLANPSYLVSQGLLPRVIGTGSNCQKSNMVWDARIVRNKLGELMRLNGVVGIVCDRTRSPVGMS